MTKRVLAVLVDDEPEKRFLLERLIHRNFPFVEVRSFSRCDAAVETMRSSEVELLITNGRVGNEDGLAFISTVHMERPDLPIVVVTLRPELAQQARENGVAHFVVEDEPEAVRAAIEGALSHRSSALNSSSW